VAVGRRVGDRLDADVAGAAGPVLDHHALPGVLLVTFSNHAGENVDRAARRERRDDLYGLGGKRLCAP
jgi:hypothetical protein